MYKEFEDSEKGAESDLPWNESLGKKVTSKEVVDLEKIKESMYCGGTLIKVTEYTKSKNMQVETIGKYS